MPSKRVVVAMSGGVDSSVAAALLIAAGYEVIGVTMQIWPSDEPAFGGCCGLEAVEDAKRVAYQLDFPHYVLNLRDVFAQMVIDDFCREYSLGRTPNPCVRCNQYIKFDTLLDRIKELDASFMATGHYARIESTSVGYHLLKAVDQTKDQSYFLYTMGQKELQHLLLPLGDLHKAEVRELATKLNLPVSVKRDSQDVCFIPDGNYRLFLASRVSFRPGDIVDTEGKVLGRHKGLAQYTVGQRQGLGLTSNRRLYVARIDVTSNKLVVGNNGQLQSNSLVASGLNWVSGRVPERSTSVAAKVRYRSPEVSAKLHFNNRNNRIVEVRFQQPQWAITPGQSVVFYHGDTVLGGGIIQDADAVAY
jgi:tRNA-specific 2-thiouridylase